MLNPDCQIISSRILQFDKALVFRAWSEAEHLKKWWGPKGFTNTFEVFEFKVGGAWKFVMHGPDKGNYANECTYTHIVPNTLICWKRISKPHFKVEVHFTELSNQKTELVFKMIFSTKAECDKLKPFVVDKNEENFDKLADELARMV